MACFLTLKQLRRSSSHELYNREAPPPAPPSQWEDLDCMEAGHSLVSRRISVSGGTQKQADLAGTTLVYYIISLARKPRGAETIMGLAAD